jgi:hypothetical protein
MSDSSGQPRPSLLDYLLKLLEGLKRPGPPPTPPVTPAVPADNQLEPAQIVTRRVLLVIYDPIIEAATGLKLSQYMKWGQPDHLANAFIQDILETSGGMARYQIVQQVELDEFPPKTDGYRYDAATYFSVLKGEKPPHIPKGADYNAILTKLNVLPQIARREIDEVWIFAFPQAGFHESVMGGTGAFWCNAPPMTWSSACPRRFVVMGFSYERGVGEMLESFGHRTESILIKCFEKQTGEANLYARFSTYDKLSPGKAEVGNIHFAPNSERDYDWNNSRKVKSNCYDWYNFPHFRNDIREVNADEWGNGDMRAHHKWWLNHLPRVAGRSSGVANNWWQYILSPELVMP